MVTGYWFRLGGPGIEVVTYAALVSCSSDGTSCQSGDRFVGRAVLGVAGTHLGGPQLSTGDDARARAFFLVAASAP